MSYYTVAAVAFGVVCAVAYAIYDTWQNNPRQRQRNNNNSTDRRGGPTTTGSSNRRRERPKLSCDICAQQVQKGIFFSCDHQFHRTCLHTFLGADNQILTYPRKCIICDSAYHLKDCTNDTVEDCSICLYAVEGGSAILSCGHEFHQRCLLSMLERWDNRCPNCRITIGNKDLKDIVTM